MAVKKVNTDKKSERYDFDNLTRNKSRIKREFTKGLSFFVVIAALLLLAFVLYRIDDVLKVIKSILSVLSPIFYGLAFAYLINPLMKFIERNIIRAFEPKTKNKERLQKTARGVGLFMAITIILAVLALVLNMMIPQLYSSIKSLVYMLPQQTEKVIKWINDFGGSSSSNGAVSKALHGLTKSIRDFITTGLTSKMSTYMNTATKGVFGFISQFFNAIIGLIISIYILISKEKFAGQCKKLLYAIAKPDKANFTLSLTRKSNEIFGGFLIGKIIDSLIVGVLCFIGMSIFGFTERYTLLISVFIGVTNIIPFFGPYLGAIPSTILIMLENPMHGLYFVIFIIVMQQLDGNILGAKILGNSTGLSACWVVIAILIGGGLFGILGMILGVPVFAVLYYIFHLIIDEKLKKKELPINSEEYIDAARVDTSSHKIEKMDKKPDKEALKEMKKHSEEFIKEFIAKRSNRKGENKKASSKSKTTTKQKDSKDAIKKQPTKKQVSKDTTKKQLAKKQSTKK